MTTLDVLRKVWCAVEDGKLDKKFFALRTMVRNEFEKSTEDVLKDSVRELAEYLLEAHQEELLHRHYGEKKSDCSYCQAIKQAEKLLHEKITQP